MSDDIELNVDTLEPEYEEKVVSEEEYSCGQRVPMRKPATLVQYWINTGNPPYKVLLDENELSETGSSLSEKEITSPSMSLVLNAVNAVNAGDTQKHKNDSSCSSVDTAAYILSNANITKKADTTAIIEGAKCIQVKSLKDVSIKDIGVPSNGKNEYIEITKNDRAIHNDDGNVDAHTNGPDIELYPISTKYTVSKICDRAIANTLVSANIVHSNMYLQGLSSKETDKMNESSTSQRNLDVQTIDDIASIFRQFQDKTSKQLIGNNKNNDVLNQSKVLEMDIFHEKQMSDNLVQDTLITKDTSMTAVHRKKLYTGRDSPVDLILTETHGISRLSGARQSLHPALDPDGTIKKKTFLVCKSRNKCSLSAKRSLGSKKVERRERRDLSCISIKTVTDISTKYTNNDQIQDSNIDSSFKNLSDFHNNLDRQDDIPFREYSDTNISVRNEKCKQNLLSLNLKPVVLLERIKPSFKRCKLKSGENTHIAQEKSVHNNRHLNKFKKLYSCEIENLELETIDSDGSTILICQCNMNASQCASSLSDCSVDLKEKLNIEDDFSASNAGKKGSKLSNLKDTDMSQNKKLYVEGLSNKDYTNATMESQVLNKSNAIWQNVLSNKSETHSCLYRKSKMENVKLREIKVVLERLPLSVENCTNTVMEMEILNKNDAIWQKEISNKSKTHSHPYEINKKNNIKLREIRVVLERLPSNICLKGSSNVTNTNIFFNTHNKKKILQNTDLETNHKRESQIRNISKILACENVTTVRPVCDNYSLRMNTKSKEKNDKINDTFEVVIEHGNQVFDKVESNSTFQHEASRHRNRSKTSQNNCSKYSVLTFTSSDEDDFIRSIQHPRKKSKVSIDDILGETNITEKNLCDRSKLIISDKGKYYNGNLSTVICSSENTIQRDIGSIKEKKEDSKIVEINSFSKTQTAIVSLDKNERFVFFSSEDDNDSVADNSDKHKKRISFFDRNRNINDNSRRRSSGAIKRNGINRKDNVDNVIFFQTKTFDTNSSDSEESNSYIPSCKALKSSSIHDRLRYHNCVNSEKIFNDSIANKHSKRHLSSSNSFEKHNLVYDVKTRSKLIGKEAKANKRLTNESSNGDIKSRISDTRKDTSSFSLINDIRDASVQEKTFSNTFLEKTNLDSLLENKKISNKFKNSIIIQQDDITSTVRKLLMFQTKSYYDSSDSSEIL